MSSGNADQVLQQIRARQRFLVTAHARPDGDAVGSLLACAMLLQALGKTVDMVLSDRVPLIYQTLPGSECIRHASRVEASYDAVILLECDGIPRTRLHGLENQYLINLDHHSSGRTFGSVNWIDPEAPAVGAMVYQLTLAAGVTVTPAMATCLYTAVLTDTGLFAYPGTDASTLRLAASLVDAGADPASIARDIYFTNPTSKMRLLGAALSHLHREGRIAWLWVTTSDLENAGAAEEDCEGIVNYAIGISGVEVAAFLRELPDHRVRMSLRSKNGVVNVAAVAEGFGGGGHENASGCTLNGPLHSALETMLATLRTALIAEASPAALQHSLAG
jgi:phosphoesterase RecJ-like protein